jgi:tetratricopeptide (TPR) repeat protein
MERRVNHSARNTRWLAAAAFLLLFPALASPVFAQAAALDTQIAAAFNAAYNLDHETALATARAAVAGAPAESRAHRTLASILWLQALFRRGAVTVDHYMGGLTRSPIELPKPPPEIEAGFRQSIGRAIELAEARHRQAPRDLDALHDVGAAYGLQASWTASVDGRVRAAFGTARRAYKAEEEVLERDPRRVGSGTIVGTYRYAISGLGLATRVVAYMAGFGGGKEAGIALLEAATAPQSDSRFEARTALVLIYSREGRHQDAFRLLTEMSADFPQNRILVLERAAAALRAGHAGQAESLLTPGIAGLDTDTRRKLPGERALWFYRRGLARIELNRPADAASDLDTALRSSPEEWVRGRILIGLGKLDDIGGRRPEALAKYRAARDAARKANDPAGLADAQLLLRQPFARSR